MRKYPGRIAVFGAAQVIVASLGLVSVARAADSSIFNFLFGNTAPAAPTRHIRPQERLRPRPPAPVSVAHQAMRHPQPSPAPAPKPDFTVAVFGDGFAPALARGLSDTDSGSSWQVLDRSGDDVGLAGLEATDWNKAIDATHAQAAHVDAAIVLLGSNDGVPIADAQGQKQAPSSPGWRQSYGDRVARLADQFRDKHIPLIWVGLPIVRDANQAQLYAAVNEIVQDRATHEGATFVDSWQPFADENGDFSTTGPDVTGHPATLRWTNGWNFTRAGAKKLASFVLPDLNRIRDRERSSKQLAAVPSQNPDPFDQALSIDVNAQILKEAGLPVPPAGSLAPAPERPGPVLLLTAAPVARNGELASVQPAPASADPMNRAHPGRADDFTWPRP